MSPQASPRSRYVSIHELAAASRPIEVGMRDAIALEMLSRRAPMLVVVNLCAALPGYWTQVSTWLPYGLAITSAILALVLMATSYRRRQRRTEKKSRNTGWLSHELGGTGSPSGTYPLVFFCVVTIALTGFQGAYALPAWAGLALTAAWAIVNAHYPPEDGPGG